MNIYVPHLHTDVSLLVLRLENNYTINSERLKILKDLQETNEQILAHEFNLAYQRNIASMLAHTILLTIYYTGSRVNNSPLTYLADWIPCAGAAVAIFSISGFWAAHRVVDVLEYQRSVLLHAVNHLLLGGESNTCEAAGSCGHQDSTSTQTVKLALRRASWQLIDLGSHRDHPNTDKASKLWISKQFGFWSPVGILVVFLIIWLSAFIVTLNGKFVTLKEKWNIPTITILVLLVFAAFANFRWWVFKTKFLPNQQRVLPNQQREDDPGPEQGFWSNLNEWIMSSRK